MQAQNFGICPNIGANTAGCGALITVGVGGAITVMLNPVNSQPYDGSEDALIGVINNSGGLLHSLTLTSGTDLFGFDDDGICSGFPVDNGPNLNCTWPNPTGYEGPNTSFANINAAATSGTVLFTQALANGGSTYFSLEETPADILAGPGLVGGGTVTPTAAPEPASLALVGGGLLLIGGWTRRRRA